MAGVAGDSRVRAKQRKTIEVIADVGHRDAPAANRVAVLAGRAHLAGVNVGVTIRALLSHLGKHRVGVALAAMHALVHAAQGELGFGVVIELRLGADGLPA